MPSNLRLAAQLRDDELARMERRCPSQWVLDKLADEKLTGGYDVRRANRCDRCFTFKSKTGACNCA